MIQMVNAALGQGAELGKQRLREFLENSDTARQALSMPPREGSGGEEVPMERLDGQGRRAAAEEEEI